MAAAAPGPVPHATLTSGSAKATADEVGAFDIELHGCLGQGDGHHCTGAWWGLAENVTRRLEWLRKAHEQNSGRGQFGNFEHLYR